MLELGRFGEIIIIGIAALILIGPKELPKILRTLGRWSQKIHRLKSSLTHNLDHYFYEGKFEEYQDKANEDILNSNIQQENVVEDSEIELKQQNDKKSSDIAFSPSVKTHGKS